LPITWPIRMDHAIIRPSHSLVKGGGPAAHAAFLEPGGASSIPPVTKQNRLQHPVFWLRRCSLAFMISLMSPAGRISKMLPYFTAGC